MIVTNDKDTTPWTDAFKKYDPSIDISIYPNIQNKEDITFALVWSKNNINFADFPNLKCIASMGAGVDHIISNKSIANNVAITKIIDEKLVESMWEYLLGCVMNIVTNHYKYIQQQKKNIWHSLKPRSISNTTIGIMGLGQLGLTIAKNFSNMGFQVKGYSKSEKSIQEIKSFTTIEPFIKNVDILINLLPLTTDTKNILNYELFLQMNHNSYIINVGRGEHLVDNDLLKVLNENILDGAILDVFHTEPLESHHPFWNNDKIVLTPHSASLTDPQSVTKQIMENYQRVKENKEVLYKIDNKKGY
jgi:glyoxylate/hydroxypyruvate reductase A